MSVYVWKDGKRSLIESCRVKSHLESGYSFYENEAPTIEEADTNNSGKLSTEEVRNAAEKAGIEGFATKRIKTLKAELGYDA